MELIVHEMLFSLFLLVEHQQPEPKTEQAPPPVKKEALIVAETKALDGSAPTPPPPSGKKKNPAKKQKTEPGIYYLMLQYKNVSHALMQNPTAVTFIMKTFFQNPVEEPQILPDSAASANHQTAPNDNVPSKASGKKQKREADKGYINYLTLFRLSSVIVQINK